MRRIFLLVTAAAIVAAMLAASAMPAMAFVSGDVPSSTDPATSPPEPPAGKPFAAGSILNDPPGDAVGPINENIPDPSVGGGDVGASVFPCSDSVGADVFNFGQVDDPGIDCL